MEGSCVSSEFIRSVVDCQAIGSCSRIASDFYNGNDPYTTFYFSAVQCALGACAIADFNPCSCCDGQGCPNMDLEGNPLPSCQLDTLSFCTSKHYFGLTCAAWGNPICSDFV
jgi:hypothetical protein